MRRALAAFLATGIAACAACMQRPTIVVGVDLPLTGNDGAEGLMTLHGIELAAMDCKIGTSTTRSYRSIVLMERDTAQGTVRNAHQDEGSDVPEEPRNGVASLHAFAADPGVVGVVGAQRSDVARAEAPVARELRLPVVSTSATDDDLRPEAERALFALGPSLAQEGRAAAAVARRMGYLRVFIDHDQSRSGREVADALRAALVSAGARLARSAADADAVFFKGPADRAALLLPPRAAAALLAPEQRPMMRHRGYTAPSIATPYVRIERAASHSSFAAGIARRFRQQYGEMPSSDALAGYVAMRRLCGAVAKAVAEGHPTAALRAPTLRALRAMATDRGDRHTASAFVAAIVVCGRRNPPASWRPSTCPAMKPRRGP